MLWYREGLGKPPEAVKQTAQIWRQESDQIGRFLDARCVVGGGQAQASALYEHYKEWAEATRERRILSAVDFGKQMHERFCARHTNMGEVYDGIGLKAFGVAE
jgi:putative DNA primase/helicase